MNKTPNRKGRGLVTLNEMIVVIAGIAIVAAVVVTIGC